MEKRVFLAIFLSFAVLALYQAYFAPAPPPQPQAQKTAPAGQAATGPASSPGASSAPTPAGTPASSTPVAAAPVVGDAEAKDIVVETDSVSAVFTTKGAALKSWKLKRYFDHARQSLELIPQNIPDPFPRPFSVAVDDPNVSGVLRSALYRPSVESLSLDGGSGTLEFAYEDA